MKRVYRTPLEDHGVPGPNAWPRCSGRPDYVARLEQAGLGEQGESQGALGEPGQAAVARRAPTIMRKAVTTTGGEDAYWRDWQRMLWHTFTPARSQTASRLQRRGHCGGP